MAGNIFIEPDYNDLPSHYADKLGILYSESVNQEHKKINGQFFTPEAIASLMGNLAEFNEAELKILDPGCGTAILTCSLIESLFQKNKVLHKVTLNVYETDAELIPYTTHAIEYLRKWLDQRRVELNYCLNTNDFVLDQGDCLKNDNTLFQRSFETFDIIISNPPYFKLPIDDKRAIAAKAIVNGHPNIYSAFMAISARLLKENGQLIFITPRSYASGGYFKLFREYFFKIIEIDKVHLFVSRKDTFTRDNVLQETVIIKGRRVSRINPEHQVVINSSNGIRDINSPMTKYFQQREVIDITSNEKILFLPTSDSDENILNLVKGWDGYLNKYNIQISTGPVVSFRAWDYICDNYNVEDLTLAPLFWLHNVKQMTLEWPLTKPDKGQYIKVQKETKSILIPNKNYILLRRFSSKDDRSRLIAAPYFCNYLNSKFIGVENKVNYIYRKGGHLDRNEVVGLCALLNSSFFDNYFRIFNGNVNVSATELREMKLPALEEIKQIGEKIILENDFSAEYSNTVINEFFNLKEKHS
jgi:adenine-specific DNA-methyltransferase